MQTFKSDLGSGKMMTIVGGFLGSQFFVFLLTVSFLRKNLVICLNAIFSLPIKLFSEVDILKVRVAKSLLEEA